jgi:hypothetical protein
VAPDQHAEVFEGEPGAVAAGFDRGVAEGFEEERLAGAGRAADDQVLPAADPFQGASKVLPVGKAAAARRAVSVERSRPATSSASSALRTSAGSPTEKVVAPLARPIPRRCRTPGDYRLGASSAPIRVTECDGLPARRLSRTKPLLYG